MTVQESTASGYTEGATRTQAPSGRAGRTVNSLLARRHDVPTASLVSGFGVTSEMPTGTPPDPTPCCDDPPPAAHRPWRHLRTVPVHVPLLVTQRPP